MKTNKIFYTVLMGILFPISLLAQTPIDKQKESRETQIQLRKLSKEGSIEDGKKLKNLALQRRSEQPNYGFKLPFDVEFSIVKII